jgi:NAD-reducing hydrogenase large subunit
VSAVVRAFDPCLSCSTHALGQPALQIDLLSPQGELLDRVEN